MQRLPLFVFHTFFKRANIYLVYFKPEAEDPQWYFVERSVATEVPQSFVARTIFLTHLSNYKVYLPALLPRHRSLQYFTSSQFFCHFFRQVKGRLQTTQILAGRLSFLCAISCANNCIVTTSKTDICFTHDCRICKKPVNTGFYDLIIGEILPGFGNGAVHYPYKIQVFVFVIVNNRCVFF